MICTVVYSPQHPKENIRTKSSPDGENIHETIKISKMSTRKIHSHHSTSTRKCKTSVYNKYHECSILKYDIKNTSWKGPPSFPYSEFGCRPFLTELRPNCRNFHRKNISFDRCRNKTLEDENSSFLSR